MKKLESSFINMVTVLSGIAVFAAITLASVYTLTKEPIGNLERNKRQEAIRNVLPPYDHFDSIPIEMNNGVETTKVYKAYDKNNLFVGAAVESSSNNGYKGHIDIIVGFNKKGIIVNYEVLEQNETPGLGSKMVDWFKTKKAKQSIIGKDAGLAHLNITVDGGEIDAITAATISSRAFLFAVRNAYFEFISNVDDPLNDSTTSVTDTLQQKNIDSDSSTKTEMKGQVQ